MGLETFTGYINALNENNPLNTDGKNAGDDHIRGIKFTLKTTFPNLTGTVNASQAELNQLYTKLFTSTMAFSSEIDNGNSGAADTIDWTLGNKQRSTLTGDVTFTFTPPPGPCNLVLKLVQDATGNRNPVWPATVKWAGGVEPSWSTAAGAIDIVSFYYDGTNYFGAAMTGFA